LTFRKFSNYASGSEYLSFLFNLVSVYLNTHLPVTPQAHSGYSRNHKTQDLMRVLSYAFYGLLLFLLSNAASAQFPAACDARKDCIYNAISFTANSGNKAHFVEIQGAPVAPLQKALTVEMWVKTERQAGMKQFLAGLWGPNSDANDVFAFYIDQSDRLCFEVNPDNSVLKGADNTIVLAPASFIYGKWVHLAAVFDGSTSSVSIYIDGQLVGGPVSNPAYPVSYLKPLDKSSLSTLIGSTNGLSDSGSVFRTFRGMMDEVRIWNVALTATQILCQKDLSLNGNEAGLRVYYRCNEAVGNKNIMCDATGKGYSGLMRSEISNQKSDRVAPRSMTVTPGVITDEIQCDSVKSWSFIVTDTMPCGNSATFRMLGPEAGLFTVTPTTVNLTPGQSFSITVTYRGTIVGGFLETLQILPVNRCGLPNTLIKLNLNRTTEVGISRNKIVFDTLYVGCKEYSSIDSTLVICNTSDKIGKPRTVTINDIRSNNPLGFRAVNLTFPFQLTSGQCTTIVIRSFVRDTTNDYLDTLRIYSDDQCQNAPTIVALTGRTQEVISIRSSSGAARVDTFNFQPTCPGQLSSSQYYTWQNLTLTPLIIEDIVVPPAFTHYKISLPFTMQPKTGYQPIAVRFRPLQPGAVFDSIVIKTRIQGCTIERKIYLRGRGLDNKVDWAVKDLVDFGNVIVGQQSTINVIAKNNSNNDQLNVALYVENGDAFTLLAGTGRSIRPRDSVSIPVTFRPIDSLTYNDKLCLFETRCYTVACIPLRGKGILQTFRFSPLVMETENVIACGNRDDTVYIVNITPGDQTITNLNFINPSGKFSVVDPPLPWSSTSIKAGDSARFIVNYNPNDVTQDRADRAFIAFKGPNSKDWQVQLIGTSATPKLFVTQNTFYGTVEAGDIRTARLIVENTSSMPVIVDSITVGNGFVITNISRTLPDMLMPRDTIGVTVEFRPTASVVYDAELTAYSSSPCSIKGVGKLNGRGIIVELESALSLVNFGYLRPCECQVRTIEMLNASLVFDMTVDSIWVDSAGVPGGKPQFYSWTSKYSPTGMLPYKIPPGERDTVYIKFCPNTPADPAQAEVRAKLHVKAKGSQWSKALETYLFGKRSLTFRPTPALVQFAPGVIDVISPTPQFVTLKIPGYQLNPTQDTVVIDSLGFELDERVFFVINPTVFPIIIKPGDSVRIEIRQRPRAPRNYQARLVIYYSKPCAGRDTTVLVKGAGFALPRGLAFSFDPARVLPDTFGMVSCDTLIVPLYSSIYIDASVVDVFMRVDFDSTQLRLLDIQSDILNNSCVSKTGGIKFTPSIFSEPSLYGGLKVTLKNFCGIDSIGSFCVMRFVTVANNRVDSRLTVDSIDFDTEDVILYKLIATGDKGRVLAYKSEITYAGPVAYDSVRILDCADKTLTIINTGDIGNTVDNLLDLPIYTSIVSSVPAMGDSIRPGDSAIVTIRFCPRAERGIDTSVIAVSLRPCETRDTTVVTGYGYAPELDVSVAARKVFWVPDTLGGAIGDTIEIPIMLEKDVSAFYNNQTYWLNGLNFDVDVKFNPRALKFISIPFMAKPSQTSLTSSVPGNVSIAVVGADSVQSGPFVKLRFAVTVPDVDSMNIEVSGRGYVSDSLQFLDIVPVDVSTPFVTSGKCDISVLKFSTTGAPRIEITPNPVVGDATITFRIQETVPVHLTLCNSTGVAIREFLNGSITLTGGEYAVRFTTAEIPAGVYFVRINGGVFASTAQLVIVK